jgi:hypothetical protein
MPTCDGFLFRERDMMVVSTVYKHKTQGTVRVLPSSRPLKKKPYMMLVICIDDAITNLVAKIGYGLAKLGFVLRDFVFWVA